MKSLVRLETSPGGGTYMGEAAWMGMGARSMKGVAVVVRRMEDMVADGG